MRLNIEELDCRVYIVVHVFSEELDSNDDSQLSLYAQHIHFDISGSIRYTVHLPLCQLMYGTRFSCILELHFIINHIYLGAVHAHNLTVLSNLMCTVQLICLYYNFLRFMCTMCTMFIINKYILNCTWLPFLMNIKIESLL